MASYTVSKGLKRHMDIREINTMHSLKKDEQYRLLIHFMPEAITIQKSDKILYANKKAIGFLGFSNLSDVINKNFSDLFHPHPDYIDTFNKIENVKITGSYIPAIEEKLIRKSDNQELCIETIAIPITYQETSATLFVSRDISERKRVEELNKEIEKNTKLLNEAKEYDNLKTEFFANISHELRTPLNLILSTLQLCDAKLHPKLKENEFEAFEKYFSIMKQNCFRLLRMVNNLIDVTKIDAGYFEINLSEVDIVNLVEDITLSIAHYIEIKNIRLVFDTDIEEKFVACDVNKLERIILNIISNSVKFTKPGGSIFVKVQDKENGIIISIKDTGIGIPKEKQEMIFERFAQIDKSLTRCQEGSGIGLSIAKSLVELLGGKLRVESEYGKGSEFIIELPLKTVLNCDSINNLSPYDCEENLEKVQIEFSDIYF